MSAWKGSAKFSTDDFFTLEGRKFDVIYDYTFLCAIEPNMRKSWAEKMKQLLKPGGELVTLIFPLETREGGPPYAMSIDLVTNLLEPEGFVCDYLGTYCSTMMILLRFDTSLLSRICAGGKEPQGTRCVS